MGRKTSRHRQSQHCLVEVFPASALRVLRLGTGHWREKGFSLRKCPACGHVAQTRHFPVVNQGEQGAAMVVEDDDALLEDKEGR